MMMMILNFFLTLQAASMVLHSAPEDGSAWKACATYISWAVCTMNAQRRTSLPIPRNDK